MVVLVRTILLYLLIICTLRLMGKRQLNELQPSELVSTILISNIASIPIEDQNISMLMAIIPILTIACLEIFLSVISLRFPAFRSAMTGRPIILIREGELDQDALKQLRFTIDDLMETLRGKDVFDIREVYYAVVETSGQINVLKYFDEQNLTPGMLQIKGSQSDPPLVVIGDGKLNPKALSLLSLGEEWVSSTLMEKNLQMGDVFLMTANHQGVCCLIQKKGKV